MVSPSKIFKTSNNGLNVGSVSFKKDCLRTNGATKVRPSSQVIHSRLLANTKFYLDIRNRIQLNKVQTILKSYGAKIEIFFKKGIKVIVTDKAEWMGNGHNSSPSVSPLTTPSPSANQDPRFIVPKSRASAMLEKVSKQPASAYSSPLELVQKWRIPVLSVRSLWKWIAKVEEAYVAKLNEKKKEKILESKLVVCARDKAPFIKIESIISSNIPEFLELETWPSLNLDGRLGQCPFRLPSPPSQVHSNEHPQEVANKLFEGKDKVAVELIKYDTDFRIKENIKLGECEEEGEQVEELENQNGTNIIIRKVNIPVTQICINCYQKLRLQFRLRKGKNETSFELVSKMTRRPAKNNTINNEDDATKLADSKLSLSPVCNGHINRSITRQSSQELLKVQCNGLITCHRNSKLLSPSGSDVLPLPSSRRSTRRASASWCGSTRELSQLSPTDSEIENIRRSDSSFEAHDSTLDSPGITLRPKGQLWLPIALIGTTAEENGNCIRKRYEYSIRQSENAKLSGDFLDAFDEKQTNESEANEIMPRETKESNSSLNSSCSQNEYQIKKNSDKKDTYCMVTRNNKVKSEEMNGRSRESSVDSIHSNQDKPKSRVECKKRSLSVPDRTSPSVKRARTMSINSVHLVGRKKKLSPEEKLLQDNKEYFKMEVLNTKLRSTGSLLNVNQNKEIENSNEANNLKPAQKVEKIIIKKIKVRGRKKGNRWTKASSKKSNSVDFTNTLPDSKKPNVKINGVIRKKRQSELMKLCNEAESFMFGESSRQGHSILNTKDMGSQDSPRKKFNTISTIKTNHLEENPLENHFEGEGKIRKKRRSHAEAFIHDNLDYYKFETPGSRLRYQGNFLDIKSEDKDFVYTLKQKKKEMNKRNNSACKLHSRTELKEEKLETNEKKRNFITPSEEINKILFSFETIPLTEPWYEVYKRQDEGLENYFPLLSNPNDQPFLLPYELPKSIHSKVPAVSDYYKRRRKKLLHLFNHPRKSPRCHASTLAILSSLKKRKRRSGTNISMNSLLSESLPNSMITSYDKREVRPSEIEKAEKNEFESQEILNLFYNDESLAENSEILLEPCSDSEGQLKRKSSDTCKSVKSDEEETKNMKINNRNKKLKTELSCELDSTNEKFKILSWQAVGSDDFYKDTVIETQKKSGLIVDITTILENFRNCKSMEQSDLDLTFKCNEDCAVVSSGRVARRRRKKARKINKTGWDNRKSRRRTNAKLEVKDIECSEVKKSSRQAKIKIRQNGINSENIINSSKRCMRRMDSGKRDADNADKPLLRSHLETPEVSTDLRRTGQENESRSDNVNNPDFSSCVIVMRKMSDCSSNSTTRLRCSNGKSIQKRRLILKRKKKRVIDYAWTTRKR